MSSGAYPGYNLFTKSGRYNLLTTFKHPAYAKPSIRKVLRYTFAPLWCSIVGHDKYDVVSPYLGGVSGLK